MAHLWKPKVVLLAEQHDRSLMFHLSALSGSAEVTIRLKNGSLALQNRDTTHMAYLVDDDEVRHFHDTAFDALACSIRCSRCQSWFVWYL